MNKLEFIYNSLSPLCYEGIFKTPHQHKQKNLVTVWIENDQIHYERRYIKSDQTEPTRKAGEGIQQTFDKSDTAQDIAKAIHWGCSGTSFNSLQLHGLIEKIKPLVESLCATAGKG